LRREKREAAAQTTAMVGELAGKQA